MLGALLAAGFFKFIKMLEYETANPGQDAQDLDEEEVKQETVGNHHVNNGDTMPTNYDSRNRVNGVHTTGHSTSGSIAGIRRDSQKPRIESPAMGTTDEAFLGLAHGMHGTDQPNSRIRPTSERSNSGIV